MCLGIPNLPSGNSGRASHPRCYLNIAFVHVDNRMGIAPVKEIGIGSYDFKAIGSIDIQTGIPTFAAGCVLRGEECCEA